MTRANPIDDFAERIRSRIHAYSDEGSAGWGDSEFNQYSLELFNLQFELNPGYRRFCASRGTTPDKVDQWFDIPAVPTTAFKDLELSCIPERERTAVFFSSGTTQQKPSRHFHHEKSLSVYQASLLSHFKKSVGGKLQIENACCVALTPPHSEAPNSSLVHMFETLRNEYGCFSFTGSVAHQAWVLDGAKTVRRLEEAARGGQAVALLGTAFSYVHLIDYLGEHKLSFMLPPGSWAMETGGYKGRSRALPKPELHRLISTYLGVPGSNVVCEYGMSELSSQAYDTVDKPSIEGGLPVEERAFKFPPWARFQVISPETGRPVSDGETGLNRITDLSNVYSVMAIQTEDLGQREGAGFRLIGRSGHAEARGCSLMPAA
jgi:hypothetical protein